MKTRICAATLVCLSVLASQTARAATPAASTATSPMTVRAVASSAPNVIAISAGFRHTCAVTDDGKVWCWGYGGLGQLGTGNTPLFQEFPVEVGSLGGSAVSVSAGVYHTCAVLSSGAARCWGYNITGQLGDGTTTNRLLPVNVSGLSSGVTAISAGGSSTCALVAGGVQCWGGNSFGALGDGTNIDRLTPVSVTGLGSVTSVSVGDGGYACARTSAGGAACWGANFLGQLGDGTLNARNTPTNVIGMTSSAVDIAAGNLHTCAITGTIGAVQCWGRNFYGQLGTGNLVGVPVPTNVVGLTGVVAVAVGDEHSCALTATGGVKCWGYNMYGQIGDGTDGINDDIRMLPVDVVGLSSGVVAITAGSMHTCALLNTGRVKCWGMNNYGQLGTVDRLHRNVPTEVRWLYPRARLPIVFGPEYFPN